MKVLKTLGIITLLVIAAFLITPLFLPKDVLVHAEKKIKVKPEIVFAQVNNLRNWKRWSPFEADTSIVDSYGGPESGVGARRTWSGEHMKKVSLAIVKSEPDKLIENKLIFGEGNEGATGVWHFTPADGGVKVSWTIFIHNLKYPFERWYGLMSRSMMKPLMQKGLDSLATAAAAVSEKKSTHQNTPAGGGIQVMELSPKPSLTILDSTTIDSVSNLLQKDYGILMEYIKKKQIPISGYPFAVYYDRNQGSVVVIRAGIPISGKERGNNKTGIDYFELPGGKVIFAKHIGGYDTGPTHYAIEDYIRTNHLHNLKNYIWEIYKTGPANEPDTTKWETDIYYPLKSSGE